MIKKIKILLFLIIVNSTILFSQEFPVYSFKEFEPLLHKNDDKVYVINFWATWCRPCVKEIPTFNQLYETYKNNNVEIILVSLDFGKNLQSRILDFKNTHNIKATIIILDDPDSNSWIDKVNKDWSGAIPTTIIYNKKAVKFFEQSFDYKELENELKNFL
ncbi:MAG TPA: thioredoxin [Bacteroidales bacterium]|jgi:thiol-disulfide isomerase/thioredoxin|nr:thioredoxin [Bacteroidales bacterium]